MIVRLSILLSLLLFPILLHPQTMPKERSSLNHRLIGFSFPVIKNEIKYTIEIAYGDDNDEEIFKKNLIRRLVANNRNAVIEVPDFGKDYTWRVMSLEGMVGGWHHFSTGTMPNVDTARTRMRIIKAAEKYNDAHVFVDQTRALYDMKGNALWYLPATGEFSDLRKDLRDMKLTPQGTVTFLIETKTYEVDCDGNVLWRGPKEGSVSGDSTEYFHHQLTRLHNGHYMVLGNEYLYWKPEPNDSVTFSGKPLRQPKQKRVPFGTVIEYDEQGNVVWSWKSSAYYTKTGFYFHRFPTNVSDKYTVHENAFYFDEKNSYLYVSFKNTGQVIKIKYPSGVITNVYGDLQIPGVPDQSNRLFCDQHACKVADDGELYLFNNNACHYGASPTVVAFKQPEDGTNDLEKTWEYEHPLENRDEIPMEPLNNNGNSQASLNNGFFQPTSGGNVWELENKDMFVSMCAPYCNIYIVSRDKKILWDAMVEHKSASGNGWEKRDQYRASIVTDNALLKKFILNWHPAE